MTETGFWDKMLPHLFAADWYIGVWAVLTIVFFFIILRINKDMQEQLRSAKPDTDLQMLRKQRKRLSICYSLFTTFISIFPLWGMFGTVRALLVLDMSAETQGVQEHFFEALTSTAWGILFAIGFKVLNAWFVSYKSEELLEKSDRLLNRPPRQSR